jgi:hypothetical protein
MHHINCRYIQLNAFLQFKLKLLFSFLVGGGPIAPVQEDPDPMCASSPGLPQTFQKSSCLSDKIPSVCGDSYISQMVADEHNTMLPVGISTPAATSIKIRTTVTNYSSRLPSAALFSGGNHALRHI